MIITKLLVINTNGYEATAKNIKIVKIKTNGDPIEKYMKRKNAYETDFIFELSDKQIKKLKTKLK